MHSQAWRKRNPEKLTEYSEKHREASLEISRKWNRDNPEYHRSRYRANAEAERMRQREYTKANPIKKSARNAKYRASKARAAPSWLNQEKIEEFYFATDFLGMVTGEWYHVDHIVPLQSNIVCGLHWEYNLQILPGFDNQSKSNRYWPDMP